VFDFNLHEMLLLLPAIIIGLTFHEFMHGQVADLLGDHTARDQGRLTLNPIPHIDPIGFIMLIIAKFGWAKPVPVNPLNFRGDMKRGMLLVSLAGPATNIVLAFISAIILGAFYHLKLPYFNDIFFNMILINVILGIFNLIPIPPLDGSKILAGLLPGRQEWLYKLEAYGMIILIVLVFSGAIGFVYKIIIIPIVNILVLLAGIINKMVI
jgi:Zn-dependent protease